MDWRVVPEFMSELRGNASLSARLLEFIVLTAVRTGEAIGARWEEIDLTTKTWTIPSERMKAGRRRPVRTRLRQSSRRTCPRHQDEPQIGIVQKQLLINLNAVHFFGRLGAPGDPDGVVRLNREKICQSER